MIKVPMSGQKLTVGELRETHILYQDNINEYRLLLAAYEGIKEIVRLGYIEKHERESSKNYTNRVKNLYSFEYTKAVVDLLNFYLFKKEPVRDFGVLENDDKFTLFLKDCNLYQENFDSWLMEQNRYCSIEGMVGVLVDKSSKTYETRIEELDAGVYPYVASYFPTNIFDWVYDREKDNNRPYLAYLKIYDDDGQYRLWWRDKFEIWEEPDATLPDNVKSKKFVESEAVKIAEGVNPLGEIPFVWIQNIKHRLRPLGISDVHGVARLDISIIRNLSQGEEIIDYTAFPMLRKPKTEPGPTGEGASTQDEVGEKAILEFDPEMPDSKPDWLESEAKEPIEAILAWIVRKVEEIYRAVNVGGMAGTEVSTSAKSGIALQTEFQMLNSLLVRKAINLEKAEKKIYYFWGKWEDIDTTDVSVQRERKYDVEDLASDLENILTSSVIVKSEKFNKETQKVAAKRTLQAADDEVMNEIFDEIDKSKYEPYEGFDNKGTVPPSNEEEGTEE